jgi:endonuclease VIII
MPEGDSIFRAARTLHRALAGHTVERFESVLPALTRVHEDTPITGRLVESVTAAGKHILMRFSGDLVLRTHMRMNGSWHIYKKLGAGAFEPWRRPRRDMRVVLATHDFEAVGFNVPVAEFLDRLALQRQPDLKAIGPDLLGDTFDADEAIQRFRARSALSIADALINQRIVAGAGNVFKSELLFLCGIDPFARVADVTDDELRALLRAGQKYLRANVHDSTGTIVTYTGFRRTTSRMDPSERLYVYSRARKPCRKCGTRIQVMPQGPDARLTYWCPTCQRGRS